MLFIIVACTGSETKLQRFLLQGNEMAQKQNFHEAKRYYREALKLDSCFADALNNLGTLLFKEGNFTEALTNYNQALDCKPDFYDAYLNRANTFYELNNPTAALRDLDQYAKAHPDTSLLFFSRGLNYTKLEAYDKAITSFRKAYEKDPGNVEGLVNLATVFYYKNEFDSSVMVLNEASAISKNANIYNLLSLIESKKGDYAKAMDWITQALALEPGNAYFLNNRGYLYLETGQPDKALSDIDKSIGEDPYNAWAYRNKGLYYLKVKDYVSAIRLLEKTISMDEKIEKGYFYLGDAYFQTGDKQKGCFCYQKALEKQELTQEEFRKKCG